MQRNDKKKKLRVYLMFRTYLSCKFKDCQENMRIVVTQTHDQNEVRKKKWEIIRNRIEKHGRSSRDAQRQAPQIQCGMELF